MEAGGWHMHMHIPYTCTKLWWVVVEKCTVGCWCHSDS